MKIENLKRASILNEKINNFEKIFEVLNNKNIEKNLLKLTFLVKSEGYDVITGNNYNDNYEINKFSEIDAKIITSFLSTAIKILLDEYKKEIEQL